MLLVGFVSLACEWTQELSECTVNCNSQRWQFARSARKSRWLPRAAQVPFTGVVTTAAMVLCEVWKHHGKPAFRMEGPWRWEERDTPRPRDHTHEETGLGEQKWFDPTVRPKPGPGLTSPWASPFSLHITHTLLLKLECVFSWGGRRLRVPCEIPR